MQDWQYAVKLFLVQAAVFDDVLLVVPSRDAGVLHGDAHRAAVVGAVEQEAAQDFRISGHKAGTQAGDAGTFRQAGKHDQPFVAASQFVRRFKAADGFFAVEIDFRVAFVRGDGEAVFVL